MATTETRFNQSLAKGFGILEAFSQHPVSSDIRN
jgi:IclR family pca regulon transcriptional regulator